jgi:hypothetical protein
MVKLIFFGGAKYAIFRDTHIHPLILVVMYPIIYTCIYIYNYIYMAIYPDIIRYQTFILILLVQIYNRYFHSPLPLMFSRRH